MNLSPGAEAAWMIAAGEAAAGGHALIEPAHLLIGALSLGKLGSGVASGELNTNAVLVRDENALSLPLTALVDGDREQAAVFTLDNGVARRSAVQIDAIEGDTILIENKDIDGFDLSVLNGATEVIRTVEWEAIGY